MEPPFKRPRLSMFKELNEDRELSIAREQIDRRLKSRFESIFEKYERDFSNVADEIDLVTGQIVVNKGHLASMQNEKDTGIASSSRATTSADPENHQQRQDNGKRLLRAMTMAPEDYDQSDQNTNENDDGDSDNDDEIMILFERIAQKAASKSSFETINIKEENLSSSENDAGPSPRQSSRPYDSDGQDSLLGISEARKSRSGSVDSLLEVERPQARSGSVDSLLDQTMKSSRSSTPDSLLDSQTAKAPPIIASNLTEQDIEKKSRGLDDDALMRRYGSVVGKQILEVLHQRRAVEESKIEPAWRIPEIGPALDQPSSGLNFGATELGNNETEFSDLGSNLSDDEESLWSTKHADRRRTKLMNRQKKRKKNPKESVDTAESDVPEDPLPVAFPGRHFDGNGSSEVSDWKECIAQNICPYCRQHKLHLSQHFRLAVDRGDDGLHDIEWLANFIKSQQMGQGDVKQFLDIVQFKELDNLGNQEIANRINGTLKDVYNIYYQYRATAKTNEQLAAEGRAWTKNEDKLLTDAAQDPEATFRFLKSKVPGRKYPEIGNRLATLHMRQFEEQGLEIHKPVRKENSGDADVSKQEEENAAKEESDEDLFEKIKREEEDEDDFVLLYEQAVSNRSHVDGKQLNQSGARPPKPSYLEPSHSRSHPDQPEAKPPESSHLEPSISRPPPSQISHTEPRYLEAVSIEPSPLEPKLSDPNHARHSPSKPSATEPTDPTSRSPEIVNLESPLPEPGPEPSHTNPTLPAHGPANHVSPEAEPSDLNSSYLNVTPLSTGCIPSDSSHLELDQSHRDSSKGNQGDSRLPRLNVESLSNEHTLSEPESPDLPAFGDQVLHRRISSQPLSGKSPYNQRIIGQPKPKTPRKKLSQLTDDFSSEDELLRPIHTGKPPRRSEYLYDNDNNDDDDSDDDDDDDEEEDEQEEEEEEEEDDGDDGDDEQEDDEDEDVPPIDPAEFLPR